MESTKSHLASTKGWPKLRFASPFEQAIVSKTHKHVCLVSFQSTVGSEKKEEIVLILGLASSPFRRGRREFEVRQCPAFTSFSLTLVTAKRFRCEKHGR